MVGGKGGGESKAEGECLAEGGFQLHRLAIRGVSGFVGVGGLVIGGGVQLVEVVSAGGHDPRLPPGRSYIWGQLEWGRNKKRIPKLHQAHSVDHG